VPELPESVRNLLDEHRTMVVASASRNGAPEAASVFFAPEYGTESLTLVCALLSRSHKLAHLRENPRAGLYIGPQRPTRWLQATAAARILEGDEQEHARRLAHLRAHAPEAGVFVERVPVTVVIFEVERLKLTDLTGASPPIITVDLAS
jgi:nitroimidazol reductase NimA-like FMN-containing flavoprotein (pyridoxamine 5'-phosphate oxidase superfamily)